MISICSRINNVKCMPWRNMNIPLALQAVANINKVNVHTLSATIHTSWNSHLNMSSVFRHHNNNIVMIRQHNILRKISARSVVTATTTDPNESKMIPKSWSVVALPLCHRPLLPGMTIELNLPPKLFNKVVTHMHLDEFQSGLVGTFYVNTSTHVVPLKVLGQHIPMLTKQQEHVEPSLLAAQFVDLPHLDDLHNIGTLCKVSSIDENRILVLESLHPIRIESFTDKSLLTVKAFARYDIEIDGSIDQQKDAKQIKKHLLHEAELAIKSGCRYSIHLQTVVKNARKEILYDSLINNTHRQCLGLLVNQIAGLCSTLPPLNEQKLLSEENVLERAKALLSFMQRKK